MAGYLHLVVREPDVTAAEECPACGFDALLAFPMYALSARGVTSMGHVMSCARCWTEKHRAADA